MRQHRLTVNAELMQVEIENITELNLRNQRSESQIAILRGELLEAQARLSAPPTAPLASDPHGTMDREVHSKMQELYGRGENCESWSEHFAWKMGYSDLGDLLGAAQPDGERSVAKSSCYIRW